MRRLLLPTGVVFTCQQSGACCRNDWLIGVAAAAYQRLRAVDWAGHEPALPPGEPFRPLPFALDGGERMTFARRPDGACVFLDEGSPILTVMADRLYRQPAFVRGAVLEPDRS